MAGHGLSHGVAPSCPERQRQLLEAARAGDRAARGQLVDAHLGLVRAVAERYSGYGLEFDDLVQEGSIGLLAAIEGYDPARGVSFASYAGFSVRRAIRRALTEQSRLIRLPKQIVERRRVIDRVGSLLLQAGRRPSAADLAEATGLPVSAVLEARTAPEAPLSLDEHVPRAGTTLEALIADPAASDPAAQALQHEQRALLDSAISRLKPRERLIVERRWGVDGAEPASGAELARELDLSTRRTQTIGREALAHLRNELQRQAAR